MGAKKKNLSDQQKKFIKYQEKQQQLERQRLEQQRLDYERDRQMLLAKLAEEQAQQEQAQAELQSNLRLQSQQQLQAQEQLIAKLREQYESQLQGLNTQLETYRSLGAQSEKQKQYLDYLNTKASVESQQENEELRRQMLMDLRNKMNRFGVLQRLASQRGNAFSPELLRGTSGGSISTYNLLR